MNAERILTLLTRIFGVCTLPALPAALMPFEWMNAIHERVGLGPLPDLPIIGYLTRSLSLFYAMHGALWLFLSTDVRRYLAAIQFLALLSGAFGLAMLALDGWVRMPLLWTVCEGPSVLLVSLVALGLARKVPGAGLWREPRAT